MGFLQVLVMIASRGAFYGFIQLASRHYSPGPATAERGGSLRRSLTRGEWRTLIGMAAFASLSDLILLSGDDFDLRDLLPMTLMHVSLYASNAVAVWCQLGQISYFRTQIHLSRSTSQEGKKTKYTGYYYFHMIGLVLMCMGGPWTIFSLTWLVWTSGNSISLERILLFDQFTIQIFYIYWSTSNLFGYLL